MRCSVIIWFVIVNCLIYTTNALASEESTFLNMEINIAPLPHKVAVGYPLDMSDEYYFTKSISRVFFLGTPVVAKIVKVDIDDNVMELTVENKKYGKGIVKIVSSKDLEKASDDELKTVIYRSLSDDKLATVVVDTHSKLFHLATCNHLPSVGTRTHVMKDVAIASGYKKCGICFLELTFLPDITLEEALQNSAASGLRHFNPVLNDSSMQSRVDRIGKKVLDNWPYPLIPYDYRITVVESKAINAYALAAGAIFITSGLINAVENDDELEAVLAHETAHIQRRHSLQTYKRNVANQQAQMAIAAIGGVAVGVAAGRNNSAAAIGAAGVTLASMVALNIQLQGYSKDQEKEADELAFRYFTRLKRDLQPLKSVFKKLMYHNLCVKHNPDPASITHPALGDRVLELVNRNVNFLSTSVYHIIIKDVPIEVHVLSISDWNDQSEVTLWVSDIAAFREALKEGGAIRFIAGSKSYDYKPNETDVYTDAWSGIMSVRSKTNELIIEENTAMELEDFEIDHLHGFPNSKKYKLVKGVYY